MEAKHAQEIAIFDDSSSDTAPLEVPVPNKLLRLNDMPSESGGCKGTDVSLTMQEITEDHQAAMISLSPSGPAGDCDQWGLSGGQLYPLGAARDSSEAGVDQSQPSDEQELQYLNLLELYYERMALAASWHVEDGCPSGEQIQAIRELTVDEDRWFAGEGGEQVDECVYEAGAYCDEQSRP